MMKKQKNHKKKRKKEKEKQKMMIMMPKLAVMGYKNIMDKDELYK